MEIKGSTALVTGANRGMGRHFAEQLVARGATVYAGARNPDTVIFKGVTPVALDITDTGSVSTAARELRSVNLLINNAGIASRGPLLAGNPADIGDDLKTNYLGTLNMTRAFAPVLLANGGGAIVNMLSALSWVTMPDLGAYSVSKSAEWALTNAVRQELAGQGIQIVGVHVGPVDTDFTRELDFPGKADPAAVVAAALDGLQAGDLEVLADELSHAVRAGLAGGVPALYPR